MVWRVTCRLLNVIILSVCVVAPYAAISSAEEVFNILIPGIQNRSRETSTHILESISILFSGLAKIESRDYERARKLIHVAAGGLEESCAILKEMALSKTLDQPFPANKLSVEEITYLKQWMLKYPHEMDNGNIQQIVRGLASGETSIGDVVFISSRHCLAVAQHIRASYGDIGAVNPDRAAAVFSEVFKFLRVGTLISKVTTQD